MSDPSPPNKGALVDADPTTNGTTSKLELVEEWRLCITWRTGVVQYHDCTTRCEVHGGTPRCHAQAVAYHLRRMTRVDHVAIERRLVTAWHAPLPLPVADEPARRRSPRRPKVKQIEQHDDPGNGDDDKPH